MSGARAAVLGMPIAHSLSPELHRAAYAALGLDWTYDAIEVDGRALAEFLDGLEAPGQIWRGLSLTRPLKRIVLALLDDVAPEAEATNAANTIVFDGRRRLGYNTDIYGIVASLREAGVETVELGAVLGGGATATSAIAALKELGESSPTVYVRDKARATDLIQAAERLGVTVSLRDWADAAAIGGADVVIATTPPGATDAADLLVPDRLAGSPFLLDVVYDPWPTPLATRWQEQGGRVVAGLTMLVHQAARQVELMTGQSAPLESMRAAGAAAIGRSAEQPEPA